MKAYHFILFAGLLAISACNRNNKQEANADHNTADTLNPTSKNKVAASPKVNIDKLPVTTKDLGSFPYLTAPEGYKCSGDINKQLEEKYFFYKDTLIRIVEGKYFHTKILSSGDVFEDTFIVAEYKKAIEKLGGVEFYSGSLPSLAGDMIDKDKPAYVGDMYDPRPYQYKQYLIRAPKANIWIELCHGLNANQIDLTVVSEPSFNDIVR